MTVHASARPPHPDRRSRSGAAWLAAALLYPAGCSIDLPYSVVTTSAAQGAGTQETGTQGAASVTVEGTRYELGECRSGDLAYFLGADLWGPDGAPRVRLVIDPLTGPMVRLNGVPSLGDALLSPDRCDRLEADVRHTGWTVDDVRDVSGFLEADCEGPSGETIAVHARFEHCH